MKWPKYVIISPVRDEEEYITETIQSVMAQTMLPYEWVIVDDGSTDDTGKIIDGYASKIPWIKAVHRDNRGFRKAGGGVIEAFYDGFGALSTRDWQFIIKLDGDLSFQADYFENCFQEFTKDPKLGIGGGEIYHRVDGALEIEKNPRFHVRGATKIYRRECWETIEGLFAAPGWDAVDEVKANMLGWNTRSFESLKVIHQRYTGAADGNWRDAVKNGLADYIAGYHPLWMFAKCLTRLGRKPYLVGSFGHFYGFLSGYAKKVPQVDDPALIRYLRQQQLRRLLLRSSIWK
jgi:glycosyltransferase involved in cell wall biosynthesis